MQTIPCIFGHGFSEDVVIEENGFQGRRCPTCRTIFISPRPEPEEVFDLYHHDKAHLPAHHHIGFNPAAELAARAHIDAIYNSGRNYHSKGEKPLSILEIGCGGGRFLQLAKERGLDPYGVELNPHQAQYVNEQLGIPCETKPFTRTSFGDRLFDIIFHCDVTSHLQDPVGDFTAMREKLTPHGQLVFETGNGADIDPRYYKYFSAWQYPDHLFFFGENSIRELLKRAGFSKVHIISWSILPQLRLIKLLTRGGGRRKTGANSSNHDKVHAPGTIGRKQRIVKTLLARTMHFARFTVGALSSDPSVPRTMLVWAMK